MFEDKNGKARNRQDVQMLDVVDFENMCDFMGPTQGNSKKHR